MYISIIRYIRRSASIVSVVRAGTLEEAPFGRCGRIYLFHSYIIISSSEETRIIHMGHYMGHLLHEVSEGFLDVLSLTFSYHVKERKEGVWWNWKLQYFFP